MKETSILMVRATYLSEAILTNLFQKFGVKNTVKVYVAKNIEEGYRKYLEVNPCIIIENNDITTNKLELSFSKKIRSENSSIPMICNMSIELAKEYTGKENFKDYNAVVNNDNSSGFASLIFVVYKLSKIYGIQGIWKEKENTKYIERLEKGNIPENYWIL
jgi:hypothetical protein